MYACISVFKDFCWVATSVHELAEKHAGLDLGTAARRATCTTSSTNLIPTSSCSTTTPSSSRALPNDPKYYGNANNGAGPYGDHDGGSSSSGAAGDGPGSVVRREAGRVARRPRGRPPGSKNKPKPP
ncbi:hypothetical protein PR202_ga19203 [Eleusine coracana subsp. coracana]|uniref:AT-hook motif nuclear-localized protein n=1 Tax=Eleusine coracana subsp. coracana TaxID=191504 RepID=A0AAV5CVT2_ELECO|nr:hypothetical protein PR202_ga19203 [Eleusine coracana subsp. coracana]